MSIKAKDIYKTREIPANLTEKFARRVRELIDLHNESPAKLARELAIDKNMISNLLNSEPISTDMLLHIMVGVKRRYRLEYAWFLKFDFESVPTIAEYISEATYTRDRLPERIQMSKDDLQQRIKNCVDELASLNVVHPLNLSHHLYLDET